MLIIPQIALFFASIPEYRHTKSCKNIVSKEDANNNLQNVSHDVFPADFRCPEIEKDEKLSEMEKIREAVKQKGPLLK